jgi:hypothetical protein
MKILCLLLGVPNVEQATLKYSRAGVTYSKTFDLCLLTGLDDPDTVRFWPPIIYTALDGSKKTQFTGFRRIIKADTDAVALAADRRFIEEYLRAPSKSITNISAATPEEVIVENDNVEVRDEWIDDCVLTKKYILDLLEVGIRTDWPVHGVPAITDIMYFTNNVEITGTYESPQTLTTNSAALALRENGQSYPTISLTSYKVTITLQPANGTEATFSYLGLTQSGNNISFQVYMSAGGRPKASDGKFYCNVMIGLEAIP